jgi:hypothetical protein
MKPRRLRIVVRLAFVLAFGFLRPSIVAAAGQVLDGRPVALAKAQGWCISPGESLGSWDLPANPECKMTWRELVRRDGRILYSARYAWPGAPHGAARSRILTEVLFEGIEGSRVVRRLYGVQDDDARMILAPLATLRSTGPATLLESRVCMTGTTECGSEFATWHDGRIDKIVDHTIAEIRAQLPQGADLATNPRIDLAALSGEGQVSMRGDPADRPSATVAFTLKLDGTELHLREMQVNGGAAGAR